MVTELNLTRNDVFGSIPSEIQGLSHLGTSSLYEVICGAAILQSLTPVLAGGIRNIGNGREWYWGHTASIDSKSDAIEMARL
jgi:hypothetical protein